MHPNVLAVSFQKVPGGYNAANGLAVCFSLSDYEATSTRLPALQWVSVQDAEGVRESFASVSLALCTGPTIQQFAF